MFGKEIKIENKQRNNGDKLTYLSGSDRGMVFHSLRSHLRYLKKFIFKNSHKHIRSLLILLNYDETSLSLSR